MKIVMLARLFYPHLGGVETHVKKIALECIQDGHDLHVFTLKHEDHLPTDEIIDGIFVHRKPTQIHSGILRNLLFFIPQSVASKILERDEIWGWLTWNLKIFLQADIIHIHDVFFWYWPLRILLFWKPVYITFHGFEAGSLPTEKAKKARLIASRWTRGNIAVGGWIEKWYGTTPRYVTYGAGDCLSIESQERKQVSGKIRAIFIGRLEVDTGILVYAQTTRTQPNINLDIFGDGPLEKMLRTNLSIKLQGRATDTCTLYPQYDVAFVSSYLSIIEAMQSNVLVVAYATDELKLDYLQSHPQANSMIILSNPEQLVSFLGTFTPTRYHKEIDRAYTWARKQTWKQAYALYRKLWKESQ